MKYIVSRTSDIFGTKKPCEEAVFYKEIKRYETWSEKRWMVDTTIEEMHKKYGDLIIRESDCKEYPIEIEIYDDYRE